MRSIVVAIVVALLLTASTASSQNKRNRPERVKVTNFPGVQAVEVVNPPALQAVEVTNQPDVQAVEIVNPVAPTPAPPMRFQLVGFTTATYTGDMGGHFGVTQKCQLEFADSRMCSGQEAAETTAIPAGLSGQAWVQAEGLQNANRNCNSWIISGFDGFPDNGGALLKANGNRSYSSCDEVAPIACCALVP